MRRLVSGSQVAAWGSVMHQAQWASQWRVSLPAGAAGEAWVWTSQPSQICLCCQPRSAKEASIAMPLSGSLPSKI